jgi:hypothetical protein
MVLAHRALLVAQTPKLRSGKAALLGLSNNAQNVNKPTKPAAATKGVIDFNPNLDEEIELLAVGGKQSIIYEEKENPGLCGLDITGLKV